MRAALTRRDAVGRRTARVLSFSAGGVNCAHLERAHTHTARAAVSRAARSDDIDDLHHRRHRGRYRRARHHAYTLAAAARLSIGSSCVACSASVRDWRYTFRTRTPPSPVDTSAFLCMRRVPRDGARPHRALSPRARSVCPRLVTDSPARPAPATPTPKRADPRLVATRPANTRRKPTRLANPQPRALKTDNNVPRLDCLPDPSRAVRREPHGARGTHAHPATSPLRDVHGRVPRVPRVHRASRLHAARAKDRLLLTCNLTSIATPVRALATFASSGWDRR